MRDWLAKSMKKFVHVGGSTCLLFTKTRDIFQGLEWEVNAHTRHLQCQCDALRLPVELASPWEHSGGEEGYNIIYKY